MRLYLRSALIDVFLVTRTEVDIVADLITKPCFRIRIGKHVYNAGRGWRRVGVTTP